MGNRPSQGEAPEEVKTSQDKSQNKIVTKEEESLTAIDPQDIDNIMFTKVLNLSIKILNSYKDTFLSPNFCNNIDIIDKDPILTSIKLASLNGINSKLNEDTINKGREFDLVLKYEPQKEIKFIADMFKEELNKYFYKKNVETPNLEKLDVNLTSFPKITINAQYIDNDYVNKVLNQYTKRSDLNKMTGGANYEKELREKFFKKNQEKTPQNKIPQNKTQNINTAMPSNNQNNPFKYQINNSNSANTSTSTANNFSELRIAQKQLEYNSENNNLNTMRPKNRNRGEPKNRNRGEQNKPSEKITEQNQPEELTEQKNRRNIPKEKQYNREQEVKQREKGRNNYEESKDFLKYGHKCSIDDEHCYLTKIEICNEIKKHYYLRKNIIEAIITCIPLKTDRGYIGSFCYKRYFSLIDCKICLPSNYTELKNLPLDEKILNLTLFINNIDKMSCNNNNGFYRVLSDKEKKALFLNNNEFNKYYVKYSIILKEKYVLYVNELYNILILLDKNELINNTTLNKLADKVKEIIDNMYYLCQYYYLSAIIALLRADLNIETNNQLEKEQGELNFLQKQIK
jgi:hypothetical protein